MQRFWDERTIWMLKWQKPSETDRDGINQSQIVEGNKEEKSEEWSVSDPWWMFALRVLSWMSVTCDMKSTPSSAEWCRNTELLLILFWTTALDESKERTSDTNQQYIYSSTVLMYLSHSIRSSTQRPITIFRSWSQYFEPVSETR